VYVCLCLRLCLDRIICLYEPPAVFTSTMSLIQHKRHKNHHPPHGTGTCAHCGNVLNQTRSETVISRLGQTTDLGTRKSCYFMPEMHMLQRQTFLKTLARDTGVGDSSLMTSRMRCGLLSCSQVSHRALIRISLIPNHYSEPGQR
jgi:hypothetical protein